MSKENVYWTTVVLPNTGAKYVRAFWYEGDNLAIVHFKNIRDFLNHFRGSKEYIHWVRY